MINFIVCDNNEKIVENVVKVIDKVMIKNNIAYKNHKFVDYNQEFMSEMKQHGTNKIYILDIEVNNKSGIDIARMIRKDDLNSAIIFLTSHNELAECVVTNVIMPLGFVCKFN
ncbi:MAG: response regulator, partial [Firmicutes bacterium]|nr:response regulator [Bacillota bacterium]